MLAIAYAYSRDLALVVCSDPRQWSGWNRPGYCPRCSRDDVVVEGVRDMSHELSTGDLAKALRELDVHLSARTLRRYARSGRIPAKVAPNGRYRFDLTEVVRVVESPSAQTSLSWVPLTGGLGLHDGSVRVEPSAADRLRTATRRIEPEVEDEGRHA